MFWRMTEDIIDIGDICVHQCPATKEWTPLNGGKLSYIQIQALNLFLEEEEEERKLRFEKYVDETINQLIYNR
jgi:hypothetical protein